MRSSEESTPPVVPDRKPNPPRDAARQLAQEPTPEARARMSAAVAEVHDIIACLNIAAARVERLRARGEQHRAPDRDLPEDIPAVKPGDSLNMPVGLGGEYFETDAEAHFWGELDLQEVRESLAEVAANLARDLMKSDPRNAMKRAEELLALLPPAMLKALQARLAEIGRA